MMDSLLSVSVGLLCRCASIILFLVIFNYTSRVKPFGMRTPIDSVICDLSLSSVTLNVVVGFGVFNPLLFHDLVAVGEVTATAVASLHRLLFIAIILQWFVVTSLRFCFVFHAGLLMDVADEKTATLARAFYFVGSLLHFSLVNAYRHFVLKISILEHFPALAQIFLGKTLTYAKPRLDLSTIFNVSASVILLSCIAFFVARIKHYKREDVPASADLPRIFVIPWKSRSVRVAPMDNVDCEEQRCPSVAGQPIPIFPAAEAHGPGDKLSLFAISASLALLFLAGSLNLVMTEDSSVARFAAFFSFVGHAVCLAVPLLIMSGDKKMTTYAWQQVSKRVN